VFDKTLSFLFKRVRIRPRVVLEIRHEKTTDALLAREWALTTGIGHKEIKECLPPDAWRRGAPGTIVEVTWRTELVGHYGIAGSSAHQIVGTVRLLEPTKRRLMASKEFIGSPPPAQIYRLPSDRSSLQSVGGIYPLAEICRWLAPLYEPADAEPSPPRNARHLP
jgi:hypothetical protein